jgi:hypothetical protein
MPLTGVKASLNALFPIKKRLAASGGLAVYPQNGGLSKQFYYIPLDLRSNL